MAASRALRDLRQQAIAHTFFQPLALEATVQRMGFVQADPIRAPARAQDLILRQRVPNYRAGELERRYPELDLEEAFLHLYGFMPRALAAHLHPRSGLRLSKLEQQVLDKVGAMGAMHPRELDAHFGRRRVINGWGGYSQATKRALERLHYRGFLRVVRRDNGIRVYAKSAANEEKKPAVERMTALLRLLAELLAPVQQRTLLSAAARVARDLPRGADPRAALRRLLAAGELERQVVDDIAYLRPVPTAAAAEAPRRVRLLAPFDPLVWDRDRFEHLWQWQYRFEAYTPLAKRQRGYYALPLLWGDAVIGWCNATAVDGKLQASFGYAGKQPRERSFRQALEAELAELEAFLEPGATTMNATSQPEA
jgi:uncharacterized protein YcaQ